MADRDLESVREDLEADLTAFGFMVMKVTEENGEPVIERVPPGSLRGLKISETWFDEESTANG